MTAFTSTGHSESFKAERMAKAHDDTCRHGGPGWALLVRSLALRELKSATGTDIVDWATQAIAAGCESLALYILAALPVPANEFDVDRHLR